MQLPLQPPPQPPQPPQPPPQPRPTPAVNAAIAAAAAAGDGGKAAAAAATGSAVDVAQVLADAVSVAQGTQASVMKEMQDTLGKANSKVAERVVGLLKELDDNKQQTQVKVTREHTGGAGGHVDSGISLSTDVAAKVQAGLRQAGVDDGTAAAAAEAGAASQEGQPAGATEEAGAGGTGSEGVVRMTHAEAVAKARAATRDGAKAGASRAGAGAKVVGGSVTDVPVIGPVVKVKDDGTLEQQEGGDGGTEVTPTTDREVQHSAAHKDTHHHQSAAHKEGGLGRKGIGSL